jgi:putative toxin-antitoxin system antitoxin component (TIGR02293 family)
MPEENVVRNSEAEWNATRREIDVLARQYHLTDREQEALRGIAMGSTGKELAARMGVSPTTVKAFIRLIMIKMGSSTRAELVARLARERAELASDADAIVESVIDKAREVIGNRDEAMRWLGTPVRALDYATPISLLGTAEGARRVKDVLGQIEYGVW